MTIPTFCSWGLSPRPSAGTKASRSKGLAAKSMTLTKKHTTAAGYPGDVGHQVGVASGRQQLGGGGEEREHHRPEEEGALLAGPEGGEDVVGGQIAAGVGGDVLDVEVVGDQPLPQRDGGHQPDSRTRRTPSGSPTGTAPAARASARRTRCTTHQSAERRRPRGRIVPAVSWNVRPWERPRSGNRTWRAHRWRG